MKEENKDIDISSMCLNCRKKLEIPISVYDEMGKCVFHEELNK